MDTLKRLVAEELGLVIPTAMRPEKFLEIIMPFRERLIRLVDDIVRLGGPSPIVETLDAIQQINSELCAAAHSKRFLAYRAVSGFTAGNKTLIGTVLLSGALGLGGHLAGCGLSIATGFASKLVRKWKPVKENASLQQLTRSVRASLQPATAKLLSTYLGISTRAVEVWQLRQELVDTSDKASAIFSNTRRTSASKPKKSAGIVSKTGSTKRIAVRRSKSGK